MMSCTFNTSNALCTITRSGQHLCVGALLVLVSVAITWETYQMLEIITGLVGALVIYSIKERASKRRTCADKLEKPLFRKSHAVGRDTASAQRKTKRVRTQICKSPAIDSSSEPTHGIAPALHHAEPRAWPSFADGMPLCEQVEQLLQDVLPREDDRSVCEEFARLVAPYIRKLIPEAQIDVIAHSSVTRVGRTGLSPEVDLVVTVPPKVLAQRLFTHSQENTGDHTIRKLDKIMEADENTVNKAAVRVVAAQLSCCRLWRTAYRGVEPKVVLLAPLSIGILSETMHVHVYVNCLNPIRSREVYRQSDNRIQKFIAFVRRWAQHRCIANTAYGHMPLYAWSLFAEHFCQSKAEQYSKASTIELFSGFVDFCSTWLDSSKQTQAETALQIEDPFDSSRNVADCMTPMGVKCFREELERAKVLLASEANLLTLMQHSNPPSHGNKDAPEAV